MKVPSWLLRLLPTWDYLCPSCKKEVPKNSRKCPFCDENYGVPLRVPPQVLKDRKALESYVHQHIFPKVSAWQRKYLTRFFTEIFNNGFEEGNFSAWTGTSGTPTIVTDPVHHGSYAAQANASAEIWYKTFAAQTIIYARFYFRVSPVAAAQIFRVRTASTMIGEFFITAGGYVKYSYKNGTVTEYVPSFTGYYANYQVDTWYCVEIKHTISATDGQVELFWEGASVGSVSGKDTDDYGNIVRVDSGICYAGTPPVVTVDCVVVADAYIGVEGAPPEGQPYISRVQQVAGMQTFNSIH